MKYVLLYMYQQESDASKHALLGMNKTAVVGQSFVIDRETILT